MEELKEVFQCLLLCSMGFGTALPRERQGVGGGLPTPAGALWLCSEGHGVVAEPGRPRPTACPLTLMLFTTAAVLLSAASGLPMR